MRTAIFVLTLLGALAVRAVAFAPGSAECGALRAGDSIVIVGDSITEHGVTKPCGYYHVLTNAAAASPELAGLGLRFAALGFGGCQVKSWSDMERDSVTNTNRWTWYRTPGWNLKTVFDGKVDVIVVFLGMNDLLQPSIRANDEDVSKWVADYRRFIGHLRERCRPRLFVLATITPLTADPTSPKNRVRELLNNRIRRLAGEADDIVVADAGRDVELMQGMLYLRNRDAHLVPDFVHPDDLGHAVIAESILDALGVSSCDGVRRFWRDRDLVAHRCDDAPELEFVIEPCRVSRPDEEKADWIVHYEIPNDSPVAVEARLVVPEGWTVDEPFLVGDSGNFLIRGTPDRATNVVKLVATFPDGMVRERSCGIPASWRLSEDGCVWKRYTAQNLYTGGATVGSIDPFACFFGWKTGTLRAARRVWSAKDRDVRAVLSHQGFSETLDLAVSFDGREVWRDGLDRNGRNRLEKTLHLHEGWNAVEITCVHHDWQRQFAFDIEPLDGDGLDDLRFDVK